MIPQALHKESGLHNMPGQTFDPALCIFLSQVFVPQTVAEAV